MIRDYRQESRNTREIALGIVDTADEPEKFTLYLSFSKYGEKIHEKENKSFLDNIKLDFELGVINAEEYKRLRTAHKIIENSIKNGSLY